jgi:hypothetical protein
MPRNFLDAPAFALERRLAPLIVVLLIVKLIVLLVRYVVVFSVVELILVSNASFKSQ